MKEELAKHGANIDAIYYCPHHPDDGCDCRKPKTVLFQQAASELDIDFNQSYVVGDIGIDIQARKTLGCRTVLVTTGHPTEGKMNGSPDFVAGSLLEAVRWILEGRKKESHQDDG